MFLHAFGHRLRLTFCASSSRAAKLWVSTVLRNPRCPSSTVRINYFNTKKEKQPYGYFPFFEIRQRHILPSGGPLSTFGVIELNKKCERRIITPIPTSAFALRLHTEVKLNNRITKNTTTECGCIFYWNPAIPYPPDSCPNQYFRRNRA